MTRDETAAGILRRVRDEILTDAGRWTRDWYARDARGHQVDAASPLATRWCLWGACVRLWGDEDGPGHDQLARAVRAAGWQDLALFNDQPTTTFADIRAVLDQAIVFAEQEDTA